MTGPEATPRHGAGSGGGDKYGSWILSRRALGLLPVLASPHLHVS